MILHAAALTAHDFFVGLAIASAIAIVAVSVGWSARLTREHERRIGPRRSENWTWPPRSLGRVR